MPIDEPFVGPTVHMLTPEQAEERFDSYDVRGMERVGLSDGSAIDKVTRLEYTVVEPSLVRGATVVVYDHLKLIVVLPSEGIDFRAPATTS